MPVENIDKQIKQEYIDGVIYDMSPAADYKHSNVIGNIYFNIRKHLGKSLCKIYAENIDIYLGEEKNCVIPDIAIICDVSKFKVGSYYGTPKFVVEVLSPRTRQKDLTVKKDLYEKYGVGEYWIVDYKSQSVDIYILIEGKYQLTYAYMLQDDQEEEDYNAEETIILKEFPNIQMQLQDIFE